MTRAYQPVRRSSSPCSLTVRRRGAKSLPGTRSAERCGAGTARSGGGAGSAPGAGTAAVAWGMAVSGLGAVAPSGAILCCTALT
ncbi:hypothetical protein [Streptomyces sp. NPDC007883]|uniref:hypothetical protein n=1 Tax=Streptomyces sp. NPDC007883 TaxID=3155116 RepID=UPI00340B8862